MRGTQVFFQANVVCDAKSDGRMHMASRDFGGSVGASP